MPRLLVIDFETYYDQDYSLRKMTTANYIVHPYFEALGAACRWVDEPKAFWVDGPDLQAFFDEVDWPSTAMIAHNMMFDGAVLKWHYSKSPGLYIDTMGMAQAKVFPYTGSASLGKVAEYLGIGIKGSFIVNAKGKRRRDFTDDEWEQYKAYGMQDADLEVGVFKRLAPEFPKEEIRAIDLTARMFIEPQLHLDEEVLEAYADHLERSKAQLLVDAGLQDRSLLMSNDKLAAFLTMLGVDPPTKISPKTGKTIYAFAKTDFGMQKLLESDNEKVQAIAAARVGHKSTIEQTRTERFLDIARNHERMPVPLRYYAAHTGRYGGTDKINVQNLGRESQLRRSIKARPGHKIVAVDASQIEARLLATVAGEEKLVEGFRLGKDIYSEFATDLYGYPVSKAHNPRERHVGKTAILGLGYGMGSPKFNSTVRRDLPDIDSGTTGRAVYLYRDTYTRVTGLWRTLGKAIPDIKEPYRQEILDGLLIIGNGVVELPNGMALHYRDLTQSEGQYGPEWTFKFGKTEKRLHGPLLTENIIQALARIHIFQVMVYLWKKYKIRPVLQVHDELVYHVPEKYSDVVARAVIHVMSQSPEWLPNAPLSAEAGIGDNYLEAK